jgi:hypothetical protein
MQCAWGYHEGALLVKVPRGSVNNPGKIRTDTSNQRTVGKQAEKDREKEEKV